jgi:hypothetical protein
VEGWKKDLRADPTGWLLDSDDPSVRYLTLVDLIGVRPESNEAREAREELMRSGPVARILDRQRPDGNWGREEDFYVRSKYSGTVWNVNLLAEMGADPEDERVRRAGEFVLRWSQRVDGGFTHSGTADGGKGLGMSCLSGNMVWALSRLGFRDDPRIARARGALVDLCGGDDTGFFKGRCTSCRSGAIKMLKALCEIREPRADEVHAMTMLREQVVCECLPGQGRGPRPEWKEVWFPLFWNTDLVEILDILGRTGELVPEAGPALDSIITKQDGEGRWRLERSFRGRCVVTFEPPGKPSRWATLRVLTMLRQAAP